MRNLFSTVLGFILVMFALGGIAIALDAVTQSADYGNSSTELITAAILGAALSVCSPLLLVVILLERIINYLDDISENTSNTVTGLRAIQRSNQVRESPARALLNSSGKNRQSDARRE